MQCKLTETVCQWICLWSRTED